MSCRLDISRSITIVATIVLSRCDNTRGLNDFVRVYDSKKKSNRGEKEKKRKIVRSKFKELVVDSSYLMHQKCITHDERPDNSVDDSQSWSSDGRWFARPHGGAVKSD